MGAYKAIQDFVKQHGISIKTCWIAHMKEKHG